MDIIKEVTCKKTMGKIILSEMTYLDTTILNGEKELETFERKLERDAQRRKDVEREYFADERRVINKKNELAKHYARREMLDNRHQDIININ